MKNYKRIPKKLKLGETYRVYFPWGKTYKCKFIQPTKCGYNFLDMDTNKCILKRHLYPSKAENHKSGDWFFIIDIISITSFNPLGHNINYPSSIVLNLNKNI